MSAPSWYRCTACGSVDAFLSPWPRVYRESPAHGHMSWYSVLVPGSALYCYPGCLPVPLATFTDADRQLVPRAARPVQQGLGL